MKHIIGNWKMFPKTLKEAKTIAAVTKKVAASAKHTNVIICPPMVYLGALYGKGKMGYGVQDVHFNDEGAHTGDTSPAAAKSVGASYAIIGHSERRAKGEDDELIAKKVVAAVRNGLTVVLCVGERARDLDGEYFAQVREQLLASLAGFPKNKVKQIIVAYEPIWAIGKDAIRPATPEDLHEMVILIKKTLVHFFGKQYGFKVPIIYGGSVDEVNAVGFLTKGEADGLLIGRVSLDTAKFTSIIRAADKLK